MDAALDRYLDQMDVEPGDDDEHYGWYKAEMGEAWTVNAGIGINEAGAVRIANDDEARGVRRHWREMGIAR
jgi:hypothetical protein